MNWTCVLRRMKEIKKTKLHYCQFDNCLKHFTSNVKLKNHINAIHKHLRYYCKECPKDFGYSHTLKNHQKRAHKKIREFCDKCKYSYSDHGSKSMHNCESYLCNFCQNSFPRHCDLKNHICWKNCFQCGILMESMHELEKHFSKHDNMAFRNIFDCGGNEINSKDIFQLWCNKMLNDNIVVYVLDFLSRFIPKKYHIYDTFCLTSKFIKFKKEKQVHIIPHCEKDRKHWYLFIVEDSNKLILYDSFNKKMQPYQEENIKKLQMIMQTNFIGKEFKSGYMEQKNGIDCALFMIKNIIEYILLDNSYKSENPRILTLYKSILNRPMLITWLKNVAEGGYEITPPVPTVIPIKKKSCSACSENQKEEDIPLYSILGANCDLEEYKNSIAKNLQCNISEIHFKIAPDFFYIPQKKMKTMCPEVTSYLVEECVKCPHNYFVVYKKSDHICDLAYSTLIIIKWKHVEASQATDYYNIAKKIGTSGKPDERSTVAGRYCESGCKYDCEVNAESTSGLSVTSGCTSQVRGMKHCKYFRSINPPQIKPVNKKILLGEDHKTHLMHPLADHNATFIKKASPIAYCNMTAYPHSVCRIGNGQERPFAHMTITCDFTAHFHR